MSESGIPNPKLLPLIVVVLVVPAFVGFAIGGAAIGTAMGALSVAALVVVAARARTRGRISFRGEAEGQPVVVLALVAIDDPATANAVATIAEAGAGDRDPAEHGVLVMAPARSPSLQRWLSDTDQARVEAQEVLAVSLATLAAAGCHAEGRVVDADPVQAIEDVAAQQGAERVAVVVSGEDDAKVADDLSSRVDRPVHRVEPGG